MISTLRFDIAELVFCLVGLTLGIAGAPSVRRIKDLLFVRRVHPLAKRRGAETRFIPPPWASGLGHVHAYQTMNRVQAISIAEKSK